MKIGVILSLAVGSLVLALPALAAGKGAMSEESALEIGTEAYVYGYPLVMMEVTRQKLTNVASPQGVHGAPVNQLAHARTFLTAGFTDVVAPNNDTLYSQAWLDLAKEPMVLHLPDSGGRYYLMPMLSAWTDVFASPGSRTTGTHAGDYAIVGPRFHGALPPGVHALRSPTNLAWLIGRTYSDGTPADLAAVHAFQDGMSLKPLSAYGAAYTPPAGKVDASIDMVTSPREQVDAMDATTFFGILAAKMLDNPPAPGDAALIARMAKIGIHPGCAVDPARLDPAAQLGVVHAPVLGQAEILIHEQSAGERVNGWILPKKTGKYGKDYLQRALIAAMGLGANLPRDAVYPMTKEDSEGKRLNGKHRYVLHFASGATPPVKAFWSVTMYDDAMFFVDNPLGRYAVHSKDPLTFNQDGSLDLLIQHDAPNPTAQSNWLPAPAGDFVLMMRMYWPKKPVLTGTWTPPAVVRDP
jgi:DNA sulfur modification protein DndE